MDTIIMTLDNIQEMSEEDPDKKEFWKEVHRAYVEEKAGNCYILGEAHCIACGYEHITIAPWPVGVETKMECAKCGLFLAVYDEVDEIKIEINNGPKTTTF